MTEPFKIRLRGRDESYLGQVTEYLSVTFTPKWNGVGSWSIKLAGNSKGAQLFVPGCGINVRLPDGTDFSGHAVSFLDEWDNEANSGAGNITITGVQDKAILGYRCVLPTPTASYEEQTAAATYSLNASAETVIKTLIDYNLGPSSFASRRLSGLQIALDQSRGAPASISARFDNLLDLIQRVASPQGMGFDMRSIPGGWEFDIQTSDDVSSEVIFSRANGSLSGWSFGQTPPTLTRAIVAGAGAGIARNIHAYDQAAGAVDPEWGYLIENFIDKRDTNLTSDMFQAATEAFAAGQSQQSFAISVVDTDAIKLGEHYRLGSKVSIDIRGVRYSDLITEISYTSQPNQLRIKPIIGSADAVYGRALDIYRVVKSIAARTALLERRY